jgi:thymidylate synthase ThyX
MRQQYYAQIIADSSINNNRVTTFEITFPRFIAEQLLTHRMLSRNAGSLRATPTKKLIHATTVEPLDYLANRPGMSGGESLVGVKRTLARLGWEIARQGARAGAMLMSAAHVHKETVNRVLAPFLWQTFVITSNTFGWENFFKQRCSNDAQPEIARIAELMRKEYYYLTNKTYINPYTLENLGFNPRVPTITRTHIPYDPILEDDFIPYAKSKTSLELTAIRRAISVARIARVSYFNHGSDRVDYQKDLGLYDRLRHSEHYSPFDHILSYDPSFTTGIYSGWRSLREELFPEFIQKR